MKTGAILITILLCFSPLIAFADECVEGDCVNGTGTIHYSTGHKFTGGFKEGMRHGKGVMQMPGQRKLVGVWQNNEIIEGKITYPDGRTYTGQWQFRERSGQGTLTWPDGRKYIGEFDNGHRHGKGTLMYPDGRQYVGDFLYGERTGQGTMTYPNGVKYSGGFKDGERHGQGTLMMPDGSKKVGEFRNGEFIKKME
jgi:hypothetical protein